MKYVCLMSLVALLSGCGGSGPSDAPERYDVQGKVTFAGNPIPQGTIQFVPSKGNKGPAGSASIVNGEFNTADGGTGIIGGSHEIIFNGFDGNAKPDEELPLGEPLFYEHRMNYDFPETNDGDSPLSLEFEVPESAKEEPKKRRVPQV